jgi:hypothetical protein
MEVLVKETTITPLGLLFLAIMCIVTLAGPRRYVILGLLMAVCCITIGQKIIVANLTFTVYRVVILVCWVRLAVRREFEPIGFNSIDGLLLIWVVVSVTIHLIARGTMASFINRMGFAYDTLGIYFFFRFAIRDMDDIIRMGKMLAFLVIPVATFMIVEKLTQRNLFSAFGGVPEMTGVREGTLRCQGPFRHPILSGTFGATLFPLFLGLWKIDRKVASIGLFAALIVVGTSGSGGPLSTLIMGIFGFSLWAVRPNLKLIRWVFFFLFTYMAVFMKAPVWYLTAKISNFTGGTGWHRSYLMEQAARYVNEWWLCGTDYTAHWMPYQLPMNPKMVDITNQYLATGVDAGFASMILFMLIIAVAFTRVGRTINLMDDDYPLEKQLVVWTLGVALLCHATAFFGVAYFDQLEAIFYLSVASISSIFASISGLRPASTASEQLEAAPSS